MNRAPTHRISVRIRHACALGLALASGCGAPPSDPEGEVDTGTATPTTTAASSSGAPSTSSTSAAPGSTGAASGEDADEDTSTGALDSTGPGESTGTPSDACAFTNPNEPSDDPNPPHDGVEGRVAVSANPVPDGFPTPQTTGICGVGLTPEDLTPTEGRTIRQDGLVIDGEDIDGKLTIDANNVTVRNSRITTSALYVVEVKEGVTGTVIEDTRIRGVGPNPNSAVQGFSFYTLRRVHISGGGDNIKANAGVLVEDSYVTGLYKEPGAHADVVQIRNGSDYTFRHNTLVGPWQASNAVFIIQAKAGDIDGVLVEDNYLSGGGYTIYTTQTDPFQMTNAAVLNNRFELDSWSIQCCTNSGGATYRGNTELPSP